MYQREAGGGAGMKQKYTVWPGGYGRATSGPTSAGGFTQCVEAGCSCSGEELRGQLLAAGSGRATFGCRGQWAG